LTGLRFVAALGVLAFHRGQEFVADAPAPLRALAANGYVGVSLFFVLSGFILAYTYYEQPGVRPPLRAFYEARLARIYPVYLLGLLVALPFGVALWLNTLDLAPRLRLARGFLAELLLLQSWHPDSACGLNCPGWSLSVEVFFYLLFPFLAWAFFRTPRTLTWFGVAFASLAVLPPSVYSMARPDGALVVGPATHTFWVGLVKYLPALHLGEFLLGIVSAGLYVHAARAADQGERLGHERLTHPHWPAALLLGLLASAPLTPYLMVHNGMLAPLFGWLIVALALSSSPLAGPPARLTRLLAHPVLVLLGEASYSLYILHMPLWMWYSAVGRRLVTGPTLAHSFPLYALLVIAVSVSVFRRFEVPARNAVRRAMAARQRT
jgi:peptidoglycan/LPS O-acetylase OafA/YrhL